MIRFSNASIFTSWRHYSYKMPSSGSNDSWACARKYDMKLDFVSLPRYQTQYNGRASVLAMPFSVAPDQHLFLSLPMRDVRHILCNAKLFHRYFALWQICPPAINITYTTIEYWLAFMSLDRLIAETARNMVSKCMILSLSRHFHCQYQHTRRQINSIRLYQRQRYWSIYKLMEIIHLFCDDDINRFRHVEGSTLYVSLFEIMRKWA